MARRKSLTNKDIQKLVDGWVTQSQRRRATRLHQKFLADLARLEAEGRALGLGGMSLGTFVDARAAEEQRLAEMREKESK